MNEIEIFQWLDKECPPYSTPIPEPIFEILQKPELWGFFISIFSKSFEVMRNSNGDSSWEIDCSYLQRKQAGKGRLTQNQIRKNLIICQQNNLVMWIKEENAKIITKINIHSLFTGNEKARIP